MRESDLSDHSSPAKSIDMASDEIESHAFALEASFQRGRLFQNAEERRLSVDRFFAGFLSLRNRRIRTDRTRRFSCFGGVTGRVR